LRWAFLLCVSLVVGYLSLDVTLLYGTIMDAGGTRRVKCRKHFIKVAYQIGDVLKRYRFG
jgi:hypothetical protein